MNSDSTIDVPRFGAVYTELDEYYEYLVIARNKFALNIHHIHGEKHWMAVVKNARRIVRAEGGDLRIATLFGIFHDCCRENDRYDHEHGKRAADFVDTLKLGLTTKQREVLWQAIRSHDKAQLSDNPTVGACWDADRLDLPRVGTRVDPAFLSTDEALVILKEQDENKAR